LKGKYQSTTEEARQYNLVSAIHLVEHWLRIARPSSQNNKRRRISNAWQLSRENAVLMGDMTNLFEPAQMRKKIVSQDAITKVRSMIIARTMAEPAVRSA